MMVDGRDHRTCKDDSMTDSCTYGNPEHRKKACSGEEHTGNEHGSTEQTGNEHDTNEHGSTEYTGNVRTGNDHGSTEYTGNVRTGNVRTGNEHGSTERTVTDQADSCSRQVPQSGIILRFIRKPAVEKMILAEAFLMAGLTRFVIRFCSFKMLKRLIGEPLDPSGTSRPSSRTTEKPADKQTLSAAAVPDKYSNHSRYAGTDTYRQSVLIARSVVTVSRRVPWESKCLVQASAARMMLSRREIPSELYLGVPKSGLQSDKPPHAWLVADGQVLLGGGNLDQYITVSRFGG